MNSKFIVIATGPSLSEQQISTIKFIKNEHNPTVIVINDAYKLLKNADYLYCGDVDWIETYKADILDSFTGTVVMPDRASQIFVEKNPWVNTVKCYTYKGLYKDNTAINCGRNSGYQAVHYARNLGAKTIVLFGFDMNSSNGKEHFFGSHPGHLRSPVKQFSSFIEHFRHLVSDIKKEGITILNATGPNSKLNEFIDTINENQLIGNIF